MVGNTKLGNLTKSSQGQVVGSFSKVHYSPRSLPRLLGLAFCFYKSDRPVGQANMYLGARLCIAGPDHVFGYNQKVRLCILHAVSR